MDEKIPARGGLCYILRMDYTSYLWIKAGAIIAIVFVVNFVYRIVNGRTIEQARRDRESAQRHPPEN
jgi:hypothetical protein